MAANFLLGVKNQYTWAVLIIVLWVAMKSRTANIAS